MINLKLFAYLFEKYGTSLSISKTISDSSSPVLACSPYSSYRDDVIKSFTDNFGPSYEQRIFQDHSWSFQNLPPELKSIIRKANDLTSMSSHDV